MFMNAEHRLLKIEPFHVLVGQLMKMHWSGFSFTVFTFVPYRVLSLHQREIIHIISHAGNEKDGRMVIRAPHFGPATHIVG